MSVHTRRNYALMFMDNVLFTNAMTFLSVTAVIPYFLNRLGASAFDISLASALVGIGAVVSQPVFARLALRLPRKLKSFARILLMQRLFWLAFVLVLPWLARADAPLTVALFIVCWGVFNLFTGSYSPFYMSLFAKMIAEQQRGRLRGFSGAAANAVALLSTLVIGAVLRDVPYPFNYGLLFGLGAVLLLLDALDFVCMREPDDELSGRSAAPFRYARDIPAVLRRNRPFALMVAGFTLLVVAQAGLVYFTLYAIRVDHATPGDIALFTAVTVGANVVGNISLGVLADRFGHRWVMRVSSACAALAGFTVLAAHGLGLPAVYVAFALGNLSANGYNLSSGVLIIEHSPREQIPVYISINVVLTLVFSSAFTLVGSALIHLFSYAAIFWVVGAAGALAYIPFHRLPKRRAAAEAESAAV